FSRAYSFPNSCARCGLAKALGSLNAASTSAKRFVKFSMCGRRFILDLRFTIYESLLGKARKSQIVNSAGIGLGKRNRLHSAGADCRRRKVRRLLLLFLGGLEGGLGGLGLGCALLELVHAAGGIHK